MTIKSFAEFEEIFNKQKKLFHALRVRSSKGKLKKITNAQTLLRWAVFKKERATEVEEQLQEILRNEHQPAEIRKMFNKQMEMSIGNERGGMQDSIDIALDVSHYLEEYENQIACGAKPFEGLTSVIEVLPVLKKLTSENLKQMATDKAYPERETVLDLLATVSKENKAHMARHKHIQNRSPARTHLKTL